MREPAFPEQPTQAAPEIRLGMMTDDSWRWRDGAVVIICVQ